MKLSLDEMKSVMAENRVEPVHPQAAIADGIEGRVDALMLVESDGTVRHAAILCARPEGYFEEAVLTAARNWRFRPLANGGHGAGFTFMHQFEFLLKDPVE